MTEGTARDRHLKEPLLEKFLPEDRIPALDWAYLCTSLVWLFALHLFEQYPTPNEGEDFVDIEPFYWVVAFHSVPGSLLLLLWVVLILKGRKPFAFLLGLPAAFWLTSWFLAVF